MPVQVDNRSSTYIKMPNQHLRDTNLSMSAKGLMCQILNFPVGWRITIEGLVQVNKDGKSAVTSAIKELEKAGYLVRERERHADGTFGSSVYRVVIQDNESESQENITYGDTTHDEHGSDFPCHNPVDNGQTEEVPEHVLSNITPVNFYQSIGGESTVGKSTDGKTTEGKTDDIYNNYNKQSKINRSINNQSINLSYAFCESQNEGLIDFERVDFEIRERIGYEALCAKHDHELVESVTRLIVDVLCYQCGDASIDGMKVPADRVVEVFRMLDYTMVEDVLCSVKKASKEVTNMRSYLFTCLYRKVTMAGAEVMLMYNRHFG